MQAFNRILVPIDFSEVSHAALSTALLGVRSAPVCLPARPSVLPGLACRCTKLCSLSAGLVVSRSGSGVARGEAQAESRR